MSPDKMIHMANQIAGFFQSRSRDEAIAGVADHINHFWEPRMRRQLFAIMDEDNTQLSALVRAARGQIRVPAAES